MVGEFLSFFEITETCEITEVGCRVKVRILRCDNHPVSSYKLNLRNFKVMYLVPGAECSLFLEVQLN